MALLVGAGAGCIAVAMYMAFESGETEVHSPPFPPETRVQAEPLRLEEPAAVAPAPAPAPTSPKPAPSAEATPVVVAPAPARAPAAAKPAPSAEATPVVQASAPEPMKKAAQSPTTRPASPTAAPASKIAPPESPKEQASTVPVATVAPRPATVKLKLVGPRTYAGVQLEGISLTFARFQEVEVDVGSSISAKFLGSTVTCGPVQRSHTRLNLDFTLSKCSLE